MSDVNPTAPVVVKDDPKRPWKAYISTAGTVVGTFVAAWVADTDPFTAKEAATAGISALIAGGLIGGITFQVRNPKVSRTS